MACKSDPPVDKGGESLIFGHFYGECGGEHCIDMYRLQDGKLEEDSLDIYPIAAHPYEGAYGLRSDSAYAYAQVLLEEFPQALLAINDTIIGQPDYADGGGIYLEYKNPFQHRYWLIDMIQPNQPQAIQPYLDQVRMVINTLH